MERLRLAGVHDQFHQRLAERREQRSAGRARKSVLEDLESRQEGLGIGVKEILNRAHTTRTAPWNQILGSVTELFDVDLEQAALAEIALGRRAQAIVIDDLEALVEYLNHAPVPIAGRVGFVVRRGSPLSKQKAGKLKGRLGRFLESLELDPAGIPHLNSLPGVQCRADSMIHSSDKAPGLAEQLLCDTWVVDTLETAFELAADAGRGCRFVTLQGELVEADGTLTVGALGGETTPVSQKSELRRLKNDLVRLDRQIRDDEQRLEALLADLGKTDSELDAAQGRLRQAAAHHAQCKADSADRQRELERLAAEQATALRDAEEHRRRHLEALNQLEQAQLQFAVLQGETQSAREQASALEAKLAALDERRGAEERGRNIEHLELAKQQERLQSLRDAYERQADDQRQFVLQAEEADARLQQVLADRRRIALHILNTNARLAESLLEAEGVDRLARQIGAEKEALRSQRGDLLREEAAGREERRRTSDQLHALDLKSRELRQQLESLAQRIEEEYQVRLAEVVETGASAFQAYLSELESSAGDASGTHQATDVRFEDVRDELEVARQPPQASAQAHGECEHRKPP